MTTTEPTIRLAIHDEDRAAAYRLRYELYVEDQKLFADEADHECRWLCDEYEGSSQIFIAVHDGRVIGSSRITLGGETVLSQESREAYNFACFAGIVDERDIAICTRLVVHPEYRGGHLAFRLFEACLAYAAESNAELILGNCEPHLVSHYLKLGFRPFGELMNHPTRGVRVHVAVVGGDFDYLHRVESPMLGALSRRTRPSDAVPAILAAMAKDRAVTTQEEADPESYRTEVCRYLQDDEGRLRGALADLDREETDVLLAGSQTMHCRKGDALFFEGHASRTLFVLLSGSLIVRDAHGAGELSERGALVGETAFFSGEGRLRNVMAGPGGAMVLALNSRTLKLLLAGHLAVASKFLQAVTRTVCQRLAQQHQTASLYVSSVTAPPRRFRRASYHRATGSRRRTATGHARRRAHQE